MDINDFSKILESCRNLVKIYNLNSKFKFEFKFKNKSKPKFINNNIKYNNLI